jgi:hypothetical protein
MRSLNSTVRLKKYNVDVELLSVVSQWRLIPVVNGPLLILIILLYNNICKSILKNITLLSYYIFFIKMFIYNIR